MQLSAHIRRSDNAEQSVKQHLLNVSALCVRFCSPLKMQNFAKLCGIMHDCGKLNIDFNGYIHGTNNLKRGDIDHCYAGAKYITEQGYKTDDRRIMQTAEFAARMVISHHGLKDWITDDGADYFEMRTSKDERYDEISQNFRSIFGDEEIMELLQNAKNEYFAVGANIRGLSGGEKDRFAFYIGLLQRLMQSVLIDADRTDTADFEYNRQTPPQPDMEPIWTQMLGKMNEQCKKFRTKTDDISKCRMDISDRCAAFADHRVGVCRLIVPTGGGKTLSSLRFSLEYCKKYNMSKIFYIAPFCSILEQNSDVIKSIVGEEYFLEHHSNMISVISDADELSEYELHTQRWDKPVIATTLVQLLDSIYSDKTTCVRRMHNLKNSVIIIDEVQAIPLKCVHLFNLAMNFLSKICGCAVVLCSATQPSLDNTDYPLIYDERRDMTVDYASDFEKFRRVQIVNSLKNNIGYDYDEAARFCYEKFAQNGNLLLVVNTKKAAAEMYNRLFGIADGCTTVIHISTNMCPKHRRDAIGKMKECLKRQTPLICVTTQLIEAGVDISFKCVVRSLAGMDNAAQAAGRCNRHGEYDICDVYLINLKDENLGSLDEIKSAQNVSMQILRRNYDDYLSEPAITDYFKKYYRNRQAMLSYNVKDGGCDSDLISLLSLNSDRCNLGHIRLGIFNQAFKTAGAKFCVIGSNTIGVAVPYNDEAKELILRLNSDINQDEIEPTLRRLQQYTVNMFETAAVRLIQNNAVYKLNFGNVLALLADYYDDRFGVNIDAKLNSLIF